MDKNFIEYLKNIDMLFVLDTESTYEVVENEYGDYQVYRNGELFDDRGALFASLRNVVVHSIPNVEFRSDKYIMMYC